MAQPLNQTKVKALVTLFTEVGGRPVTRNEVVKAARFNPRSKSPERYTEYVIENYPDLEVNVVSDEQDTESEDAAFDKLLGEGDSEHVCPQGASEDDCCGNPETCNSEKTESPTHISSELKTEFNQTTKPTKPVANTNGIEYCMINDKGIKVTLELKSFKNNRMVFVTKQDEVVEVTIQGTTTVCNLTQLEAEGRVEDAAFFRKLAKV